MNSQEYKEYLETCMEVLQNIKEESVEPSTFALITIAEVIIAKELYELKKRTTKVNLKIGDKVIG